MAFSFEHVSSGLPSLSSSLGKECLLQWHLDDSSLHVSTYRIFGPLSRSSKGEDYELLIRDFVASSAFRSQVIATGSCRIPVSIETTPLRTSVMSMSFFERLKGSDVVSSAGNIRGCFEESYEGILVNDLLRDMVINPDSENNYLFSSQDKEQLIYCIFRMLVIGGGGLCQPDTDLTRYLDLTKAIYKDILTICKSSQTNEVEIISKAFHLNSVAGVELYPKAPDNSCNSTIIVIDSIQKNVTVLQHAMNKFW